MPTIVDFSILVLLLLVNALFVVSEFSLLRLSRARLTLLIDEGGFGSKYLKNIMANLNLYINGLQIGITATTLAFGFLGQKFFRPFVETLIDALNISISASTVELSSLILGFFIILFLYSIFGEIAPKTLTTEKIEKISRYISPFTYFYGKFVSPLTHLFRWTSFAILKLFRLNPVKVVYKEVYSEDELKVIIATSKEEGEIDATEYQLIERTLSFTDRPVKEILTPRYKIIGFDINTDLQTILKTAAETGFSRFPVFEKELDQLVGFVHIKDIMNTYFSKPESKLRSLLRNVVTIHEGMLLDVLFRKMQKRRSHVAVVIDEFGSVEGLVTIEDIIEEIFGEIDDEFDDLDSRYIQNITDQTITVSANIILDEFNAAFNIDLVALDSMTLAGFILENVESVPTEGSVLDIDTYSFKILKMEGNRIATVEVTKGVSSQKTAETIRLNDENDKEKNPSQNEQVAGQITSKESKT
ncbi:MAG: HlyC/CorC family transporter [Candidatus Heimdallarchaeota archaeon]|nr:HlyC/CorC family transporter [Candidatus Heimdallarchaeota archaeon]